jgi:hypothetical protein
LAADLGFEREAGHRKPWSVFRFSIYFRTSQMPLASGARLGPYEITGPIGAGGD